MREKQSRAMGFIADQPLGKTPQADDEKTRIRIVRLKNRLEQAKITLDAFKPSDLEALTRVMKEDNPSDKDLELIEQRVIEYERKRDQRKRVPYTLT